MRAFCGECGWGNENHHFSGQVVGRNKIKKKERKRKEKKKEKKKSREKRREKEKERKESGAVE